MYHPCDFWDVNIVGMLKTCREEQRHVQKRKKRRAKGPSRLSFADEVDGDGDTDDDESEAAGMYFYLLAEHCRI